MLQNVDYNSSEFCITESSNSNSTISEEIKKCRVASRRRRKRFYFNESDTTSEFHISSCSSDDDKGKHYAFELKNYRPKAATSYLKRRKKLVKNLARSKKKTNTASDDNTQFNISECSSDSNNSVKVRYAKVLSDKRILARANSSNKRLKFDDSTENEYHISDYDDSSNDENRKASSNTVVNEVQWTSSSNATKDAADLIDTQLTTYCSEKSVRFSSKTKHTTSQSSVTRNPIEHNNIEQEQIATISLKKSVKSCNNTENENHINDCDGSRNECKVTSSTAVNRMQCSSPSNVRENITNLTNIEQQQMTANYSRNSFQFNNNDENEYLINNCDGNSNEYEKTHSVIAFNKTHYASPSNSIKNITDSDNIRQLMTNVSRKCLKFGNVTENKYKVKDYYESDFPNQTQPAIGIFNKRRRLPMLNVSKSILNRDTSERTPLSSNHNKNNNINLKPNTSRSWYNVFTPLKQSSLSSTKYIQETHLAETIIDGTSPPATPSKMNTRSEDTPPTELDLLLDLVQNYNQSQDYSSVNKPPKMKNKRVRKGGYVEQFQQALLKARMDQRFLEHDKRLNLNVSTGATVCIFDICETFGTHIARVRDANAADAKEFLLILSTDVAAAAKVGSKLGVYCDEAPIIINGEEIYLQPHKVILL